MRRAAAITALVLLSVLPTMSARAAGGPVIGVDGRQGVLAPDGLARYVTVHASSSDTVVVQLAVPGAEVIRERALHGYYMVPAVAYDGTGGGVSADGDHLVLIEQGFRYPIRTTRMLVLDTQRLRTENVIRLRGQFGYDASSPDGSKLYLIEYLSRRDPTRYAVRALDVRTGRLSAPIVDQREPDEKMRGYPVSRIMSRAGRWAYTLYDGGGKHPFVHALDTVRQRAFCVDLDALAGREDLSGLRLRMTRNGRELRVVSDETPLVVVDTKTLEPGEPAAPKPRASAMPRDRNDGGRTWLPTALLALVLVLTAGGVLVARARRLAGSSKAR